jgi:uncharacterized protein (DUF2141 family)
MKKITIQRVKGKRVKGKSLLHLLPFILYFLPFTFHLLPFTFFFSSCASVGNPTGGLLDSIPPVFLRSKPEPNAINFNEKKIELTFDEYIKLKEPSKKVIITPPQSKMPDIRSIGKKVTVELKDSLISNTTYTFDFTNSIVDNNEENAYEGFTFAFSTGDVIDSLVISGMLLNADNLEPMPNVEVGLHSDLADSAFTALRFLRTSMTNDKGQFWIRNVAPGTYRLYALNDLKRSFKYEQNGEDIAFYDSLITPSFAPAIRMDTIRRDSLTIDTIKEIHYTRFIPDDVVLKLFKEPVIRQYLSKTERPAKHQLVFRFNSDKGLPTALYLLNDYQSSSDSLSSWFIKEYSTDKKDITYWITDSLIYKQDTLRVEMDYQITDSLNNFVPVTDTIPFIWRNKEAPKKEDKKKETKPKTDFLNIDWTAKNVMDVFDTLKITFSEPVIDLDTNKIQIQQKVDTLWENRKFPIVQDTLNPRIFYVENQWNYEQEFRITVDSAAICSIYGKCNDSIGTVFKFNSEKEYGNLYVNISGSEGSGFGELLDNTDKPVRKSILKNGELAFEDLKPGKYYLRYIEDTNGNGKWDTGNYAEHRQPESVYYFNSALEINKFGEHTQDWNIKQIPIERQKPLDITKNKPVVKQPKKNEQKQNKQQNSGRSNPFGGSIPGMGNRSLPGM